MMPTTEIFREYKNKPINESSKVQEKRQDMPNTNLHSTISPPQEREPLRIHDDGFPSRPLESYTHKFIEP